MTSTLDKIKKQIEFYFGDSNLPRDKFLRETVSSDPGGWVKVDVIAAFSRMKQLLKEEAEDKWNAMIAEALESSDLMQVNDEKDKMRRILQFPDEDDSADRTVYVKGIPREATLDECIQFFEKFGETSSTRLRKFHKKHPDHPNKFKGTLFVEYKSKDDAQKLLAEKDKLKYKDDAEKTLIIMSLAEFKAEKKQQKEENALKRKRQEEEKELAEFVEKYKGCMVRIEGIGEDKEADLKDKGKTGYFVIIKLKLAEVSGSPIVYVEHPWEDDETVALARVKSPDCLKTLFEKHEKEPVVFGGKAVTLKKIEGDEEEKILKQLGTAIKDRNARAQEAKKKKQQGGRKGRGRGGKPYYKRRKVTTK